MKNVYQQNGYINRVDYLTCLAEDYGLGKSEVFMLASMLGPSEDFDGLITSLDDLEMDNYYSNSL